MQEQLMRYSPDTGEDHPYPSNAEQWREYHWRVAWLYNPWTGEKRDLRDIGSDVFGELIVPPSVETSNASYSGNGTYQNTNRYHGADVERGKGGDKVDDFPNTLKRRFYELTPFQREILANNYTKVEHYRDNEWRTKKGVYFHKDGIYRVGNKHEGH